MGVFKDLKELFRGMGITSKHLSRHAITIQYPEEKYTMPERSRGIVVLLSDKETGELNCTSCLLCMRACPVAAIMIDAPRDEKKKRQLKAFTIDFGLCCFCGLCEEACNFCAIKMDTKYEFSTVNAADLFWDMDKLQEMGRDVDYVDTRKKKADKTAKPSDDTEPGAKESAPVATESPTVVTPESSDASKVATSNSTADKSDAEENEGKDEGKE